MKRLLTLTLLLLPLASEAPDRGKAQRRRLATKQAPTPAEAEAARLKAGRDRLLARKALQEQRAREVQAKLLPIGPAPKVAVHDQNSDSSSSDSDSDSDSDSGDGFDTPKGARTQKTQAILQTLTAAARPTTPILDTLVTEAQAPGRFTTYHKTTRDHKKLVLRAAKEGHLPHFVDTDGTNWTSWVNKGSRGAVNEAIATSKKTSEELIAAMAASQISNFAAQQDAMTIITHGQATASEEFGITQKRLEHLAKSAAQTGKDAVNVLVAALKYAHRAATTQKQLVATAKATHPHPDTLNGFFPRYSNLEELVDHAKEEFETLEAARRTARDEAIAAAEKVKAEAAAELEELAKAAELKKAEAASELEKLAAAAKEKEKETTTTEDAE